MFRKTHVVISSLIALLLSSHVLANPTLDGSWQLITGEFIDENGVKIDYETVNMRAIKVLNDGHFSFTAMRGNDFWGGGSGTFKLANGTYTETLMLNSFGAAVGEEFSFQAELEGDTWTNTRWKDGQRVELEVWQRMHAAN